MANRDIRVMNFTAGQQIESDEVMKRLGELEYRNHGSHAKIGLFDEGKVCITKGLRVEPSSLLTVNVTAGNFFQRDGEIVLGCIAKDNIPVTLAAASGLARVDIIEGQIKTVEDKDDYARIGTVATGSEAGSVVITNEAINRDVKYYLDIRKQTGTTTPTAATAAALVGTIAIPGTIDLQENFLIYLSDGEDGDWTEVDCRGAVPNATTRAEIISAINAAVGRVMASASAGDTITLTGNGTGWGSYFSLKPPITDPDADALDIIFGLSAGGVYKYNYRGTPGWFKLAEIDMGAATSVITADLIRTIDQKDTWASESDEIIVQNPVFKSNEPDWNEWSEDREYSEGDIAYLGTQQFVSLEDSNTGNDPLFDTVNWMPCPDISVILSQFQQGVPVGGGVHRIHDIRDANYKQWFNYGKYKIGSRVVEAYGVHVDGTTLTGDSDLEAIFDPGGSDEYKFIDLFAPNSLGTRTFRNYQGRTTRVISTVEGATGDSATIAVEQEDGMQRVTGTFRGREREGSTTTIPFASAGAFSQVAAAGSDVTWAGGATQQQITVTFDNSNSPNARVTGTTTANSETRMKNYTVGVPFIVVIKEV
jgi:hypothetical protein